MSATNTAIHGALNTNPQGRRVLLYALLPLAPVVSVLGWGIYVHRDVLTSGWFELLIWACILVLLALLELPSEHGRRLSPVMPVALAIALIFPPLVAGLVAFVGCVDARLPSDGQMWGRAIFNRTQLSLTVMVASLVGHAIPHQSLASLFISFAASLLAFTLVNYSIVAAMISVCENRRISESLETLRMGYVPDFVLTWVAWGLTALLLVVAYDQIGVFALVTVSALGLVGRQLVQRSETSRRQSLAVARQRSVTTTIVQRAAQERQRELRAIAEHLHDEILPPLYHVSLLSHVAYQDLATGRLFELETDLPPIRTSSDLATQLVRSAIRDLRNNGLRPRATAMFGLSALVDELASTTDVRILSCIEEPRSLSQETRLALHLVCREAITNALTHAHASEIRVHLHHDEDYVRLVVEDNGIGFDARVTKADHFGLIIMRERAEDVGGLVHVDSALGEGTIVAARLPVTHPG